MTHIFGIDPGKETTGLCHILWDELNKRIGFVQISQSNLFDALMKIVRTADKYPDEKVVVAVEDANTNTGHSIEVVNGKRTRVYRPEKKIGAGFAKANTSVFVQMADSSDQYVKVLVHVSQTHNDSRKLQASALLKQLEVKRTSSHKREAIICAIIGFEAHTKITLDPQKLIK